MAIKRSIRRARRARDMALCGTILMAGAWPLAAQARASTPLAISVGEPEGFSNLTEEHILVVDVYVGDVRKGETRISTAPGTVRLLDPASALALLPPLTDKATVEAALSASSLPANLQLACSETSDRSRCGRLEPDVAGVIFDRDHFRLDIFVNPRFLAVQDDITGAYLPEPPKGLALINSIGAVVSGEFGTSSYYDLEDQLVVGSGDRRLRADLSYASGLGLGAQRLAFEWDRPGLRYSAGALWAPGNDIAGERKLIGAGIESQIDTRLDKDEILGSPVVVFLDQRARVDVLRDGRVLNSAIYEAGNRQIDTSNLPEGSYEIVLRIDEPGRPVQEERRFFTKSRRIPSLGRTDFFAFGGLQVNDVDHGSLAPSRHPYFAGGAIRRLSRSWALEGNVEATDRGAATAEIAATWLTRLAQVRAAAVADLRGTYGGILQVSSVGSSQLNFNLDVRRMESNRTASDPVLSPIAPVTPDDASTPFGTIVSVSYDGTYSQVDGIVSYSLANVRLLGTFFYRDDSTLQRASYSFGPSLEWDLLRKGPITLTLRGDMTATERGDAGFAGISLRLLGGRSSVTALAGARTSNMTDDTFGKGPVAALSGAWSPPLADGNLSLGAGYDHQPEQDSEVLSSEFRDRLGSVSADLARTDGPASRATQYSLGLQTTFAAGAGQLHVAGKATAESLIVAKVEGASKADTFDVLVNEQLAGTIRGATPFTLAVPAYRAYKVRIRPTGKNLLAYDSSPRTISLYPGTVAKLDWKVAPVTIKFGRLIASDGAPVANASITGKDIWSETDDKGYFQLEAPDGIQLTVTTKDGRSFATTLPAGVASEGIARLGPIVCCGVDEIRLGALDPLRVPGLGEAK
jgi:hypothetical protein